MSKKELSKLKQEAQDKTGVEFGEYNGNLSSKQCGSVGGEMVKEMISQYEQGLK